MSTLFQQKVWNACKKLPKGRVSTYKEISKMIKNPNASRAVGNALNRNPHAPTIPCHRVVKSTGEIGGFAHGKKAKILLLKKEGIEVKNNKILNFKSIVFKG